ncbi:hypothetical protein AB6A23_21680 [Paenibacillus tarimensis]
MLHITNGDIAAETIGRSGVSGTILPWREMWLDGPFMLQWWLPEAIWQRADYFERTMAVPRGLFAEGCTQQLKALDQALLQKDDIVLWFEYDLYDQAMLSSILYRIAASLEESPDYPLPEWIIVTDFPGKETFRGIGQLNQEEMASLWPQRKRMTVPELRAAAAGWESYVTGDAERIAAWIEQAEQTLPVMAEAYRFRLAMLPSRSDGLGCVERTTLQILAEHPEGFNPIQLFKELSNRLPLYGAGDLSYWRVLERMADGDRPLLSITGNRPLPQFTSSDTEARPPAERQIQLTEAGWRTISEIR